MSSLLHDKISNSYNELLASDESEEILKGLYTQLRINEIKPDSINSDNINDKMLFITMSESAIERYKNEQSHLRETAKKYSQLSEEHDRITNENLRLEEELNIYKDKEKRRYKEQQMEIRKKARRRFSVEAFVYDHWCPILFALICCILVGLLYHSTFSDALSVIALLITIITAICWKKLGRNVKKIKMKRYRAYLQKSSLVYQ